MATTILDTKAICKDGLNNAKDFARNWKDSFNGRTDLRKLSVPMMLTQRFQQITNKLDIGQETICERYVNAGIAVVKFQLADSNVLRLKKHLRATPGEIVASSGRFSL